MKQVKHRRLAHPEQARGAAGQNEVTSTAKWMREDGVTLKTSSVTYQPDGAWLAVTTRPGATRSGDYGGGYWKKASMNSRSKE